MLFADVLEDNTDRFTPNWFLLVPCVGLLGVFLITAVVIVLVWWRRRRRDDD